MFPLDAMCVALDGHDTIPGVIKGGNVMKVGTYE